MTLGEITPDLMAAYEGWLRDRGITPNTSSCYMRALRAVYNRMADRGLAKRRAPFRKIYTGIEKTVRQKLEQGVIRRLESLSLASSAALRFARDLFIFSLLACGMLPGSSQYTDRKQIFKEDNSKRKRKKNSAQEFLSPY